MNQIAEDIKTGNFKNLYLLYGSEKTIRQLCRRQLLNALLPGEDDMNLTVFSGETCVPEQIIDTCETLPFFADRRVVLVEDSGFFKEKQESLAKYIKHLPSYLCLIFSEESVDKRNVMFKEAAKNGVAAEFSVLTRSEMAAWLNSKLKKDHKTIRRAEMDLLLSYVGEDAGRAECEVEKLICYTGDRGEITGEDIRAVCVPELEDRIFDLLSDLSLGRKKEAFEYYRDLILLKEPPMRILYMMARQYRQLLTIRDLAREGFKEKEIAAIAGMHPYVVKKNLPVARRYSRERLENLLREFVETEEDVKTGRLTDRLAAELMLIRCGSAQVS